MGSQDMTITLGSRDIVMHSPVLFGSILALLISQGVHGESNENPQLTPMTVVLGHVPLWATASSYIKPAPSTDPVNILLDFGYQSPQSVATLARAVSDPSSNQYRKYLTPSEFTRIYGPNSSVINLATSWLSSQGLAVVHVPKNRKYIAFEGSVEVVGKAFQIEFGLFSAPNGYTLRAPLSNPSLPTILVASTSRISILGLDQHHVFREHIPPLRAKRADSDEAQESSPDSAGCVFINNQTSIPSLASGECSYTPSQIRAAYGVPDNLTGKGQAVAMVLYHYTPFVQADLDTFSSLHGINSTKLVQIFPPFTYSKETVLHNPPPTGFYDSSIAREMSLDTQIAHGIAPDAKLIYLHANNATNPGFISALNFAIENSLASSISNSWGFPLYGPYGYLNRNGTEASAGNFAILASYEDLFMQAAIIGMGMYFASGDSGSGQYEGLTNVPSPSYPAASPWVTAVGATALVLHKGPKPYGYEVPWGWSYCSSNNLSDCQYSGQGSGGGVANYYSSPFFQARQPMVQAVLHASGFQNGRIVPDISAVGDPYTGLETVVSSYENGSSGNVIQSSFVVGGTSMSCPLLVSIIACAAEGALQQPPFGFIAPTLYAMDPSSFNDIVPVLPSLQAVYQTGSVVLGSNLGLTVLPGYDNSTGLGTPSLSFATNLNAFYLDGHCPL